VDVRSGPRLGWRKIAVEIAVVAAVAILTGGAILTQRLVSRPAAPTATRASALAYGSPHASAVEAVVDPIPKTWQGEPVLRGQAAIDYARATTDDTPFLVGFWGGPEDTWNCNATAEFFSACFGMHNVGDRPGVPLPALGAALHAHDESAVPGFLVVRVHTHDAHAADFCAPTDLNRCDAVMVGDEIVWSGAAAVEPYPATVAEVDAAFGAAGPSDTDTIGYFPGVPQIPFDARSDQGVGMGGVVAVFPSPAALAVAAPDVAAHGESAIAPPGNNSSVGTFSVTDPARGPGLHSLKLYWLARGNVLVGVFYDVNLGPQADPIVAQAKANLATLANA
jgi:hypothetical protein